jgi:transposase-like protein
VEHIFQENGHEVRKIPILVNGTTIWVESNKQAVADGDSLMIPLDSDDQQLAATAAVAQPSEGEASKNKRANIPSAEMEAAVHKVVSEHITPAVVAKEYNVSAGTIRQWVKRAGHALPNAKDYNKGNKASLPHPTASVPQSPVAAQAVGPRPTIVQAPGQQMGATAPPRQIGPSQMGGPRGPPPPRFQHYQQGIPRPGIATPGVQPTAAAAAGSPAPRPALPSHPPAVSSPRPVGPRVSAFFHP